MTCKCEKPRENIRRLNYCRRCGKKFDPRILSNDSNLGRFQGEIALLPGVHFGVLVHPLKRERAGRKEFGMQYVGRDNPAEGLEEAADGFNYAYFSWLNDRRFGPDEIDSDLLHAAHYFAMAYAALERKQKKDLASSKPSR